MKKVLVVCNMDPNTSSRPNRMINWLKDDYEVEVAGISRLRMDGIPSHVIGLPPGRSGGQSLPAKLNRIVRRNFNFLAGNYRQVNASRLGDMSPLTAAIAQKNYDLIISHDLVLLPFIFEAKATPTRVLFDAREYYPRNYNDQWLWRTLKRPVMEYLCREYLPRCDKVVTVSEGLANEYSRVYGVSPEVIMSLPVRWDLQPAPPKENQIRIIHHGAAGRSRRNEVMVEMMDYVDERFTLDLMLVKKEVKYYNKLVSLAQRRKNVRVIPPVPMTEIVPATNQYDIGLFLVPPANFNLEYTLPNKLFEFIQSRLAVAIGPSIEMSKIVRKFNCGVVAKDFDPRSLANELNHLTTQKLLEFKEQSHQAARVLNAEVNGRRVREIVHELTEA